MEQLPSLGTAIGDIAPKTFKIYEPLLVANAAAIKSTARKTFSYGPHARQDLDVYYPSSIQENDSTSPVLIFLYGGGLVRGDKIIPNDYANGLVHANIGHFFAANFNYTVVIPDYRLISHGARFPSGGEDVALTIEWVRLNLPGVGKERDLFMMGNSAGGIHLSTYLFSPVFAQSRSEILGDRTNSGLQLRGAVMLSVPFEFSKAAPSRTEVLEAYYGKRIEEHCPLGLLKAQRQASDAVPLKGVSFLVLNGTLDPEDEILGPKKQFLEEWERISDPSASKLLSVDMMAGQNHISPPLSLGTDREEEEAWGRQVGIWLNSHDARDV